VIDRLQDLLISYKVLGFGNDFFADGTREKPFNCLSPVSIELIGFKLVG